MSYPNLDRDPKPRKISIPGSHLRKLASLVLSCHPLSNATSWFSKHHSAGNPPLRVVCISDTHNHQPKLPSGDLLIHAGDLTQNGSFSEVARQLAWLKGQKFEHKILIAGNHDVLFDEEFLAKYPDRRYEELATASDLVLGDVIYLQHEDVVLPFHNGRSLRVFGSPFTPQCGVFAFQYAPVFEPWEGAIAHGTDIVVTHGPPRLHRDTTSVYRAGCPSLGKEIARVRPALSVFGHIHVGRGEEACVLDSTRKRYEAIYNGAARGFNGYLKVGRMAMSVVWRRTCALIPGVKGRMRRNAKVTRFVNAAVVGGPANLLAHDPIVVVL